MAASHWYNDRIDAARRRVKNYQQEAIAMPRRGNVSPALARANDLRQALVSRANQANRTQTRRQGSTESELNRRSPGQIRGSGSNRAGSRAEVEGFSSTAARNAARTAGG